MANLLLPNCCFCVNLRTGTLIIAILTLIFSAAEGGYGIFLGINGVLEGWFDLAIDIINIVFAIILIVAVKKEKRNLAISWVWATAITVGLSVLLGVLYIFLTGSISAAIILFVLAGIQIYFILVVRSYAISLEEPEVAA